MSLSTFSPLWQVPNQHRIIFGLPDRRNLVRSCDAAIRKVEIKPAWRGAKLPAPCAKPAHACAPTATHF